jgi:hypothetical protein
MPETLPFLALGAVGMYALRFEEDRWRRDIVGWIEPERYGEECRASTESLSPVDVEDVVDATDAVCWRSRVSSRVNRLTYSLKPGGEWVD